MASKSKKCYSCGVITSNLNRYVVWGKDYDEIKSDKDYCADCYIKVYNNGLDRSEDMGLGLRKHKAIRSKNHPGGVNIISVNRGNKCK